MSKGGIIALGIVGIIIVSVIVIGSMFAGYYNQDVSLRTTIEQKQVDNTSEFDNMFKKISQVAQVTDAQKDAIKEIMVGYAEARSQGRDGQGSFINALHEAIPNVDTSTFNNLQNIITSSRDTFTMRQKELLDLKREHDKLLRSFPGNLFFAIMGKKPIDVIVVTSTKTEKVFATGKDDNFDVFQKQANMVEEKEKFKYSEETYEEKEDNVVKCHWDTEDLFNADPKCDHDVIQATGGGVKCTKCRGWFCY